MGRILTLLFSPAKIIPVAYKERGRDNKDGGRWLGGTRISTEGILSWGHCPGDSIQDGAHWHWDTAWA